MFGFIHESIRLLVQRKYGEEAWLKVLERGGFEDGKINIVRHYYPDADTNRLVDAVSIVSDIQLSAELAPFKQMIKISGDDVWESYGTFLITYTMEIGWDQILHSLSSNLKGFLDNLDSLHYFIDHTVYQANLRGPSFRCETTDEPDVIILHYYSQRSGLYPIVKGVVREISRRVFETEINISVTGRTQRYILVDSKQKLEEHVIFKIKELKNEAKMSDACSDTSDGYKSEISGEGKGDPDLSGPLSTMSIRSFMKLCPYHFIINKNAKIVQAGAALFGLNPDLIGMRLSSFVQLIRPELELTYANILEFINAVWVFKLKSPKNADASVNPGWTIQIKGQMIMMDKDENLLYMGCPYVTTIPELLSAGLRINSIPIRDSTRDLVLLNQQRLSEVEAYSQLEQTTAKLEEMKEEITEAKAQAENLLMEVLPKTVATQLMEGKTVDACEYSEVTVLFSDLPGFQNIVSVSKPADLVTLLDDVFTKFDRIVELNNVYKVETIGDSYMIVGGAPQLTENHSELVCYTALGMLWEARSITDPVTGQQLQTRVGIHTGPIVAGVVGKKMPRFCLFGDTVNTASRMESHGVLGKAHLSSAARDAAQRTGRFDMEERGMVNIKGKGDMFTYWLLGSKKRSLWEIIGKERGEDQTIDGYAELMEGLEGPIQPSDSISLAPINPLSTPAARPPPQGRTLKRSTTVTCSVS